MDPEFAVKLVPHVSVSENKQKQFKHQGPPYKVLVLRGVLLSDLPAGNVTGKVR